MLRDIAFCYVCVTKISFVMKNIFSFAAVCTVSLLSVVRTDACTGITLKAEDGSLVLARTTEWGGSILNSSYVVSPRGHAFSSQTPDGSAGFAFTARYGYVGIAVESADMVVEGVNEAGLSAGLFFFPGYGKYEDYVPEYCSETLADMQFVSWVLASFSTVDEVMSEINRVRIVSLNSLIGTVHWRIADKSGRQVVLEIVDGTPKFYENKLGVLTNSPGFDWQMTNLNSYVNLFAGAAPDNVISGNVTLKPFGAGSGMLGIPGDVTPPSRFVRAAFMQTTAPESKTGYDAVMQGFLILSTFNIPVGLEHKKDDIPEGLMNATQWTAATDQKAMKFYYRTAWNSTIRCIDLTSIDFGKVKYQCRPLDNVKEEPVEFIKIK